ncbi:MAG: hypothetical protein LQ346_008077 [Caloplaca aetnensis]|nr:MAG: hypothetical protein LQ346_008077 [Caloplaca aetnensis]
MEPPFPEWAALRNDKLSVLIDVGAEHNWTSQDLRTDGARAMRTFMDLDPKQVFKSLDYQLSTPLLDDLEKDLYLVARKAGDHIDSLHYQVVKGRTIVANEEAKMHMIWTSDAIQLKPVPLYLFDHQFWKQFLCPGTTDAAHWLRIANGFLRSYAFLVRHRIDLDVAHENKLIPQDIQWEAWALFIAHFRRMPDDEVAKRYRYGQMRLSRLHMLVRLRLPPSRDSIWFYEPPYWSTFAYLKSITTSLGFLLASISVALSSMQVSLNAGPRTSASTNTFSRFASMVLVVTTVAWLLIVVVPSIFLIWQLHFSVRQRHKKP